MKRIVLPIAAFIFIHGSVAAQNITTRDVKGNVVTGNNNKFNYTTKKYTTKQYVTNIYVGSLDEAEKIKLNAKVAEVKGEKPVRKQNDKPSILIIPKETNGKDIYAALNDADNREAVSKITEAFTDKGFPIIAYPDKSMVTRLRVPSKDVSDKAQGIYISGADICVQADVIKKSDGDGNAVTVILSAFDRDSGNLIAQKKATSNYFRTDDYGALLDGVIPELTDDLITAINKAN